VRVGEHRAGASQEAHRGAGQGARRWQGGAPELVAKKTPAGTAHADNYHLVRLPKLAAGKHTVGVTVRRLADSSESSHAAEFDAGE
jgi:hypothetical protein